MYHIYMTKTRTIYDSYIPRANFNGNHRQLSDRQNQDSDEQLIKLMNRWNHLGIDFKTFHSHQESTENSR